MKFYITDMLYLDETHFIDYWVQKETATRYWEDFKGDCKEASLIEMVADRDNYSFKENYLAEYKADDD